MGLRAGVREISYRAKAKCGTQDLQVGFRARSGSAWPIRGHDLRGLFDAHLVGLFFSLRRISVSGNWTQKCLPKLDRVTVVHD